MLYIYRHTKQNSTTPFNMNMAKNKKNSEVTLDREHRGAVVQAKIKEKGFKFTEIAEKMGFSRGTLYNNLKKRDLSGKTILDFGSKIAYDFSLDFPDLIPLKFEQKERDSYEYGLRTTEELSGIQRKYYRLMESYTILLRFLIKLSRRYDIPELEKSLIEFTKNNLSNEEIELGGRIVDNKAPRLKD